MKKMQFESGPSRMHKTIGDLRNQGVLELDMEEEGIPNTYILPGRFPCVFICQYKVTDLHGNPSSLDAVDQDQELLLHGSIIEVRSISTSEPSRVVSPSMELGPPRQAMRLKITIPIFDWFIDYGSRPEESAFICARGNSANRELYVRLEWPHVTYIRRFPLFFTKIRTAVNIVKALQINSTIDYIDLLRILTCPQDEICLARWGLPDRTFWNLPWQVTGLTESMLLAMADFIRFQYEQVCEVASTDTDSIFVFGPPFLRTLVSKAATVAEIVKMCSVLQKTPVEERLALENTLEDTDQASFTPHELQAWYVFCDV